MVSRGGVLVVRCKWRHDLKKFALPRLRIVKECVVVRANHRSPATPRAKPLRRPDFLVEIEMPVFFSRLLKAQQRTGIDKLIRR
jgi:hypothetical protein